MNDSEFISVIRASVRHQPEMLSLTLSLDEKITHSPNEYTIRDKYIGIGEVRRDDGEYNNRQVIMVENDKTKQLILNVLSFILD